jgi:L-xylulokinase
MNNYFLGIDNGGTMSKTALFNQKGEEIAVASRAVKSIQSHEGWNERDASLMWEDTISTIREVVKSSKVNPEDIKAIACTGHGNGLYLVDSNGSPVRNAINSTDSRAQKYIENWLKNGVAEKVLPKTAQSLWAAQPNALLSWLRDNEPLVMEKARWVLMAKDFIRMKLTGEVYAEITDMSGTSLMNVSSGEYDNEVLQNFGIEEYLEMLPPLIGTNDLAGKITANVAELTGLKEGTLVAGGMFDIDACGLASGIVDEGQMSMVVGTWGNNQYISREPLIDKDLFMTSIYSIPGWYLMLEGSPTSASNLDWFIQNFLQAEKKQKGDAFFDWLNSEVESISLEENDVVFLPFLYGCNEKSNVNSGFQNIRGEHTRAHLLRAVYEGIVFSHKHHIERLLNFREEPDVMRCTGGATQSNVWMQMFADAIGIPMEVPAGTQLGALGAAMAASVCAGEYVDLQEAVQNMTSIERRFEPNKKNEATYRSKYFKYKELIKKLSS